MSGEVSLLRPAAANPATSPELTDDLKLAVTVKRQAALTLLKATVDEFGQQQQVTFANSMGAEDMVLTD
ncbi:MAG: phosphoadenylyl-sulfate reductase, partial [Methylophilaceae bacterium]|nr:phosphoadenylyl-sulfate reductase [Methylophilaceae bacterium]